MPDPIDRFEILKKKFRLRQMQGDVADIVINEVDKTIQVRSIGEHMLGELIREHGREMITYKPFNSQAYYFFQSQLQGGALPELRPGSGIIRVSGGKGEGPGGTLTCFLSSRDGRANYFAAAGHVLSNFWKEEDIKGTERAEGPKASIYRYQKGFPATNSNRFLGKLTHLSDELKPVNRGPDKKVNMDIGVVKIRGEVAPVQRTTCYGSFGEWTEKNPPYARTPEGLAVMKCGAEETHWTYGVVESDNAEVPIYGPGGLRYKLYEQVIIRIAHETFLEGTNPPVDWSAKKQQVSRTPFAIPGDSGTMVVERDSRRPVGMLIAGSVLDGRYVMTPFRTIQRFWKDKDLVLQRG